MRDGTALGAFARGNGCCGSGQVGSGINLMELYPLRRAPTERQCMVYTALNPPSRTRLNRQYASVSIFRLIRVGRLELRRQGRSLTWERLCTVTCCIWPLPSARTSQLGVQSVAGGDAWLTAVLRDGEFVKSNISSSVSACRSRFVRCSRSSGLSRLKNRFSMNASSEV